MLYLVLLLVVASLGLLIAALTTANTIWAWISVALSVVAAGLLVLDWVRNRRRRSRAAPAADTGPGVYGGASWPVDEPDPVPETTPSSDPPSFAAMAPAADPDLEPAEENTDASDTLVVSELNDEVVVIDERPRYHLSACAWLGDRPTMALPVSEARELGFTPCGLCSPDATLAARHRSERARS